MKYLAIDPGDNTGWCSFDQAGQVHQFGEIKGHDAFLDWLEDQQPTVVICENYRVGRSGNQFTNSFSDVPTLQLIGAIKRYCTKKGIQLVMQDTQSLWMGLRMLGLYQQYRLPNGKKKHPPDKISAMAHGVYYLTKKKIRKAVV